MILPVLRELYAQYMGIMADVRPEMSPVRITEDPLYGRTLEEVKRVLIR